MSSLGLQAIAAARMGRRLTTPFERGADTLALVLTPGADSSSANVAAYEFGDHQARFDRTPEPSYVLATTRDVAADTTVTATFTQPGGSTASATASFPAGAPAGSSAVLAVPALAEIRLTALKVVPAPSGGRADQVWLLTALLGTMAKVLWVIGGERDHLRGQLARIVAQRHLPTATGRSLDLIGTDLGVPRFPPLPYGFDDGTAAVFHLDDIPSGATPVTQDVTGQYPGRTGHNGTPKGTVRFGVPGRYGNAFSFDSADAAVEVPNDAAFDIAAGASATMECFVRPDLGSAEGRVLFKHPAPGGTGAGWVLSVGEFSRGVANNVRLSVSDGTLAPIMLFADLSLPTDTFTHLAGVLDGGKKVLRLYVDGILRASAPTGALGVVKNTAPLRIGPGGSGFRGVLDEVRISAVARSDFAPVLGEADEHYRRRLRVFRRWTLPSPANLTLLLNELVGAIGGQADPLVVQDANATLVRGTRLVRIRPVELRVGVCMDAAGRRGVTEAGTVGTAAEEETFDPAFLFRYDRAEVDFTAPPARTPDPDEPQPDPHLVQVSLTAPLNRLVALAAAEPGAAGRLRISAAFDPRAGDLRATGRAALLGHSTIAPGRLAALAHRAGFDFVCVRESAEADGARVYVANAPADYFAVDISPASAGPTDLDVGSAVTLSLHPAPPADSVLRWLTVPSGRGRGALTTTGAPGSPTAVTKMQATAPGSVLVKAEVTLGRHIVTASRSLRTGLADLPAGQTIAADGTLGAPAAVVSDPFEFFDPRFLFKHDDGRVDYGGVADNHLMQPALAQMLDALLAELARRGITGQLEVTTALTDGDPEFGAHGRLLVLRHTTLAVGALAGLAYAVGFGHVSRSATDVTVRHHPGEPVLVQGPDGTGGGLVIELDEGATIPFSVVPALSDQEPPVPPGVGQVRLGWSASGFNTLDTVSPAHATVGNPTQPVTTLTGDSAGLAWVQASYLLGDLPAPHTFRVALRPELSGPDTVISKDQYDLILNILHALHPVGIEVNTQIIRDHTVEVRGNLAEINPVFTFPKFRVRSVLPPQRRSTPRG